MSTLSTTSAQTPTGDAENGLRVRVRYFAAAAEAAGTTAEEVSLPAGAAAADLVAELAAAHAPGLERVLSISSLLIDGVVRADRTLPLGDGLLEVDVLPPFAGG